MNTIIASTLTYPYITIAEEDTPGLVEKLKSKFGNNFKMLTSDFKSRFANKDQREVEMKLKQANNLAKKYGTMNMAFLAGVAEAKGRRSLKKYSDAINQEYGDLDSDLAKNNALKFDAEQVEKTKKIQRIVLNGKAQSLYNKYARQYPDDARTFVEEVVKNCKSAKDLVNYITANQEALKRGIETVQQKGVQTAAFESNSKFNSTLIRTIAIISLLETGSLITALSDKDILSYLLKMVSIVLWGGAKLLWGLVTTMELWLYGVPIVLLAVALYKIKPFLTEFFSELWFLYKGKLKTYGLMGLQFSAIILGVALLYKLFISHTILSILMYVGGLTFIALAFVGIIVLVSYVVSNFFRRITTADTLSLPLYQIEADDFTLKISEGSSNV